LAELLQIINKDFIGKYFHFNGLFQSAGALVEGGSNRRKVPLIRNARHLDKIK
jgi:hypothetical protein